MQADLVPETTGMVVEQVELGLWLDTKPHGAKLCYFIGHLAREAAKDLQVAVVQRMLLVAARDGRVALMQKRVGDDFEYYATLLREDR